MENNIYGSFFLGETELALNVTSIQEVVNYPDRIVPMPLSPDFLVGVFNLRSLIIPVINLKKLLKFNDSQITGLEKIAIVEHMGIRVGLIFDRTSEILRINDENKNNFNYSEGSGPSVISGAIKLDGGQRILQLIDPFAVVNIENVPQVSEHQQKHFKSTYRAGYLHENRKKCISFNVGKLTMAFEISSIHEIVKVEEIGKSTFETEICLGIINLRGQIVPILSFSKLIGIANDNAENIAEKRIVILKLDQELFGLLVDSVESISTYMTTDIIPIPIFQKNRSAMFEGCISIEGSEILLLDSKNILSNEEVISITRGHSGIYKSELQNEVTKKKSSKKEAYISFKLNHLFGVSIGDIREIINYPEELLCAPGLPSFVLGMLNLRGEIVTIVETRQLYALKDEEDKKNLKDTKILIFVSDNEKFGLVVDSVESIINIDSEQKIKVPGLIVQQVKNHFENDIKEIVSFPINENKEGALIILNMEPVTERIRRSMCA